MLPKILIFRAGRQKYGTGLKLQSYLSSLVKDATKNLTGFLFIVEHDPVYTIGIRSKNYGSDIETKLTQTGAEFYRTDRGGLITFHGPGQMVVYPILNLRHFTPKVKWYIKTMETIVIDACKHFNLNGYVTPDTGVWVNEKKICAMGVRISKYVTTHGIALNCNTDMSWFDQIVPCGLEGKKATSISAECSRNVSIQEVEPIYLQEFSKHFQCELESCSNNFIGDAFAEIQVETCKS